MSLKMCLSEQGEIQAEKLGNTMKADNVKITSGFPLEEILLQDQNLIGGSSRLTLSCDDGLVPVHPELVLECSAFIRNLLVDQDLGQASSIHLDGVKLRHLKQFVGIIYSGYSVMGQKDMEHVFSLMSLLQFSVKQIVYKPVLLGDNFPSVSIRSEYYLSTGDCAQAATSGITGENGLLKNNDRIIGGIRKGRGSRKKRKTTSPDFEYNQPKRSKIEREVVPVPVVVAVVPRKPGRPPKVPGQGQVATVPKRRGRKPRAILPDNLNNLNV